MCSICFFKEVPFNSQASDIAQVNLVDDLHMLHNVYSDQYR